MKKKLLAILMATAMSMTVIACGGSGEEAAAPAQEETAEDVTVDEVEEVSADYTKEQAALLDEFQQMVDNYNVAVDAANQVSQITEDEELVNIMNELTAEIDSMTELLADPANMTEEFMTGLRGAMEQTYATINRLNSLSELLPILTIAGVGVDEEENTYLFAFNEEETVGSPVFILITQSETSFFPSALRTLLSANKKSPEAYQDRITACSSSYITRIFSPSKSHIYTFEVPQNNISFNSESYLSYPSSRLILNS